MATLVDKYMEQTVLQVEVLKYDDGTVRHRLVKAFSKIIGEQQFKKKQSAVKEIGLEDSDEQFF